ncbi:MAG: ABC transporter substrate-binding protein [Rickettsiales bacterium]|nr:ABC transporter substrate-binding protein [Rickettsiales bacterium]
MWKNKFIPVLTTLMLLCVGTMASPPPPKNPKDFLRKFFSDLVLVERIKNPKLKESKFVALISANVDLDWVANFILGRHRKNISHLQKKEFVDLYSKYLASSYRPTLSIFKDNNCEFLAEEKQKEHVFLVYTIVPFNNKRIKTNFRIIEKDGTYTIVDLVIEGISFISAKRTDLNSIITSRGFDGFMEDLRKVYAHK